MAAEVKSSLRKAGARGTHSFRNQAHRFAWGEDVWGGNTAPEHPKRHNSCEQKNVNTSVMGKTGTRNWEHGREEITGMKDGQQSQRVRRGTGTKEQHLLRQGNPLSPWVMNYRTGKWAERKPEGESEIRQAIGLRPASSGKREMWAMKSASVLSWVPGRQEKRKKICI